MKELRSKAFKFRLKPTKKQSNKFAQFAGCARYVFNDALDDYLKALNSKGKLPNYYDAANKLPRMKACEETVWLKDVHSQVLQQELLHLYSGIRKYYNEREKNPRIRLPRFKKKGKKESFKYPQNIKVEDSKVWLPKIGWVRYRNSRLIEGEIKQVVIKKEAGHWYITFFLTVELEISKVPIVESEAVGIDVGLISFVTDSNGNKIDAPKYLRQYLAKLQHLQ